MNTKINDPNLFEVSGAFGPVRVVGSHAFFDGVAEGLTNYDGVLASTTTAVTNNGNPAPNVALTMVGDAVLTASQVRIVWSTSTGLPAEDTILEATGAPGAIGTLGDQWRVSLFVDAAIGAPPVLVEDALNNMVYVFARAAVDDIAAFEAAFAASVYMQVAQNSSLGATVLAAADSFAPTYLAGGVDSCYVVETGNDSAGYDVVIHFQDTFTTVGTTVPGNICLEDVVNAHAAAGGHIDVNVSGTAGNVLTAVGDGTVVRNTLTSAFSPNKTGFGFDAVHVAAGVYWLFFYDRALSVHDAICTCSTPLGSNRVATFGAYNAALNYIPVYTGLVVGGVNTATDLAGIPTLEMIQFNVRLRRR